ncbi:MAG: prolipoprotein diacylglyceryl transferase [Candidatus Kerfeldbacteria bacterium]|nr:prolipoprotein diacylglyceryl transferase [Candidatus Kerfeldbacteria bacterium]
MLQWGGLSISVWGVFVGLAFLVGLLIIDRELRKKQPNVARHVGNLGLGILLSSILGARVAYLIDHWEAFSTWQERIAVWDGGLGMLGGMIGATGFLVLYIRLQRLPWFPLLDLFAYVLPLSIAIGRLGCHAIADHPGKPTGANWGFVGLDGIPRHEPAIYESIIMLAVFGIFFLLQKYHQKHHALVVHGFFVSVFVILYGVTRFLLDFTRAGDPVYGSLTLTQYAAIVLIATGVILYQHTRAHLKNSFIGISDAVCTETAEERGGIPRYFDEF